MDNLTHTLTGLALSRAGLNRWHPQAVILLMLSANVPDSDILALSRGPLAYFEAHRGITHSILMSPVMALLCVLVVGAVSRTLRGWKTAWGLCFIGVASHLLLDWTNAYGVRFLVPFSPRWFELDLNSLIDLWIWGVLLLVLVGPWLARLVSSEMGAPAGSGRALAIFALSFIAVYDFGRWLAHQRAMETLNSRVYQGGPPLRAAAFPVSAVNPFEWSGWVERPDFVMRFAMNLREDFDPAAGTMIYKAEPGPAIEAAQQATPVGVFLKFSQYPLWRIQPVAEPEGARRVELRDWRFPFAATATVDSVNRVLSSSFHY
ncbi:MAG TPA: metal-dependent hydrolase [Bryobacteraceae bacterium]